MASYKLSYKNVNLRLQLHDCSEDIFSTIFKYLPSVEIAKLDYNVEVDLSISFGKGGLYFKSEKIHFEIVDFESLSRDVWKLVFLLLGQKLEHQGYLCIHSSCLEIGGKVALILGDYGKGKTRLSLELGRYGANIGFGDFNWIEAKTGKILGGGMPLYFDVKSLESSFPEYCDKEWSLKAGKLDIRKKIGTPHFIEGRKITSLVQFYYYGNHFEDNLLSNLFRSSSYYYKSVIHSIGLPLKGFDTIENCSERLKLCKKLASVTNSKLYVGALSEIVKKMIFDHSIDRNIEL